MSANSLSQQKTLKKLNKMLDMADKTGSTSELVNINNETNSTTMNSSHDASIVYTPFKQGDSLLSDIKEGADKGDDQSISESSPDAFFSSSGGKKLINVTKELPTTPLSTASDSSSQNLKPPIRSRNRPQSMDASPLVSDLNKTLSNISPPASPPRTTKIPLSPRKFDLLKEKNKRQSLDDVQDMLSEQLEELRSIASRSDANSNRLNFIQQPPNIIGKQATGSTGVSTDQFFSAVNSPIKSKDIHSIETQDDDVENVIVMRSSDLSIKKVVVSDILDHQGQIKTTPVNYEDDEEYVDLEDEEEEEEAKKRAHEKKTNYGKRNLKSKTNKNNFDAKTMEALLSNLDQVNDFDNLGMKNEEKKYLQLLVGNLSKLTADMILDPSKYEEGLRRLKKAALALEGF